MPDGVQDIPTPDDPVTPHEPSLRGVLGESYRGIEGFGVSAREVVPVALESVLGQEARIAASTARLIDFESFACELASADQLGFELQVAFSQTEVLPAGLLLPVESVRPLFGPDGGREALLTADFAAGRASRISERLREFLDLLSLTLFTDGLAGTEVTLAGLHGGRELTLGLAQDLVQDSAAVRVDVVVQLAAGATARITLILPLSLLARLAAPPRSAAVSALPPGAKSPSTQTPPERPSAAPSGEAAGGAVRPIDILMDGSLRVSVELGGSSMTAEEILELGPGSVVELNRLAAEPLDILVNDRLIARGEVLVVDHKFGVRITEISSPRQRANAIER